MSATATTDPVQIAINQKLVESGQYEIISAFLKQRLEQSGWMDNVKNYAKETARSKYDGVADDSADGPTFEQLMDQVGPYARSKIPDNIKAEVLEKIKAYLETIIE